MSHFSVMIFGENPEKQLSPFQENNMGTCPEEYLSYKVYDEKGEEHFFKNEDEFKRSSIKSEDGEGGFYENKNAKWDWWQLGGRWTGFLRLKPGFEGDVGEPGVLTKSAGVMYADQCAKGAIDIDFMRKKEREEAIVEYDLAKSVINGEDFESWASVSERTDNIDEARLLYSSQPVIKRWRKSKEVQDVLGFMSDPSDFAVSKKDYVSKKEASCISTFAVIKDGKWYEKGEMGWWGCVSNENDDWDVEFSKLFDSVSDDTLISIYDCHI